MATKQEVETFFKELEKLVSQYKPDGFSYLVSAQIYTTDKEYIGEVYDNNITPGEQRFLMYQNMEYINNNERIGLYDNISNKTTDENQF